MQTATFKILESSNHFGFQALRVELASGQMATFIAIPDDALLDKEEREVVKTDDYGKDKTYIFPAHKATFHSEKGSNGSYYAAPILNGLAKLKLDFQLYSEPQGNAKTAVLRW